MTATEGHPAALSLTEDKFLGDRLTIRQPRQGYRAGVDAVLLAATIRSGDDGPRTLLDIGAGVGTVGLCAAARIPALDVTLLERESALVEVARQNIAANALQSRVRAVAGDVTASATQIAAAGLQPESFDVVAANPPFHDAGAGTRSHHPLKDGAHAMSEDALDDWVRFMVRMVRPGGRATMIHKSEALPRILESFQPRFGALVVFPIFPRAGESAIRVIVSGVKASRAPLELRPGFVLHERGQAFSAAATTILRHGAALDL